MKDLLAPKQLEFVLNAQAKWNIAHGSVRSSKTVCTLFAFMMEASKCPDSQIFMVGHTSDTIYQNAVRLLLESPLFSIFKPYCTWYSGKRQLKFKDKTICTLGAKDDGAIGQFQGKTMSLVYCDEMTLYPDAIIDMIDTRLSNSWSMGFASMNPSHPTHKLKQWIDKAEANDPNYYALHFTLDDNPYVGESYKQRIRDSLSGLFYKRNYLGLWCLAEGAIFDFFDRKIHVVRKPPCAAEYWIAAIDYGTVNPFCCLIIGVSTGKYTQTGKRLWVEKEFYWDPKAQGRQKTNSEFADCVQEFIEPYSIKSLYLDPSAEAFQLELRRRGIHVVHANNAVEDGIQMMTSEMKKGNLYVCEDCVNTIREIESYVWDPKAAQRGDDIPMKKDDHACVVGDTVIQLEDGEYYVGELAGIIDWNENNPNYAKIPKILNYNLDQKEIQLDSVLDAGMTRLNADIWELELEDGKILQATGDHKIMTQRGYIELQQLTLSDMIMVCNSPMRKENG
jgi:PBSX family phage terminase large subunit